ncbi:MAG: chromosome segregation protein SMC [Burkholderiaceae bacterium]
MRLTQIKLSGFKSFVDPTHFQIPGQLVGVVGPNGCGKSNIIDAARWVLGESKASELRGESMQDVIFNGSGNRKPAGRASVELVFDNADGRAGGQWSEYAEIAVKRILTRDGTSNYYINNQVVRRRDVQDIFLGTGLGPRAYAIIGQGMITRIIEAKPEELRVFLEEAAGVSKYKERRRETENRLSDTRENLTRVDDILRELSANLEKLEAQAVVAQKYRDLQAQQDECQQLLWMLRYSDAKQEQERHGRSIEEAKLELEGRTADLRRIEAELETTRSAHYAAGDAVHAVQGELYEASASVSQLEAQIKFVVEARDRLLAQIGKVTGQKENWAMQAGPQHEELEASRVARLKAQEAIAHARSSHEEHVRAFPNQEAAARDAQEAVQEERHSVTRVEQALQVESAHQTNAQRELQNIEARRERLIQERAALAAPEFERIDALRTELSDAQQRLSSVESEVTTAQSSLPELESQRLAAQEQLGRETSQAAHTAARLAALLQLQESVQTHDKLQPWLDKHELAKLPRLWQRLHVEPGWETALESVLRERIAALEVSKLDWTRGFFADAPPAKLAFFGAAAVSDAPLASGSDLVTLGSKLQLDDPALRALLEDWLANVYLAQDPQEALERRASLPSGGVFVVRAGHLIGRNSVRFYASDSEQAGMLARQQEIDALKKQSRAEQLLADEARSRAIQCDAAFTTAGARLDSLRASMGGLTQKVHKTQLELQRLEQQSAQTQARAGQIEAELVELDSHRQTALRAQSESESRFEALDAELAEVQARFEDRQLVYEAAAQSLAAARLAGRDLERKVDESEFHERNIGQRIAELERSIEVANVESERLAGELLQLQSELAALTDEAAQAGLQDALAARLLKEQALTRARTELDALAARLREADESRLRAERDLEPLRGRITDLQLKEQACRLNQEQFLEQLAEARADLASLEARLVSGEGPKLRPAALQADLTRIQQALTELGAVNLAALEELQGARERRAFLDAQSNDLKEAIGTLEDAIRKIDRETRHLLQETFDAVNRHFGELFPALFGGGEARLVMTGEEILDAGVQVMAQPPGKKNSTIHLLSGGEKALTATALVFGMFQLNPAPFCLLDEVDAPLDDANTERFCALVRKMSAQTQFLFISHNKIAMEMANQLIGVTMQEQGVSRIVAVDMDAAVNLVNDPVERVA